jgi:uncharacterized protein (TIGR00255 family)
MTGFARADGIGPGLSWYWEVRTVNGRGLDVRVRVPPGYERFDQIARKAVAERLVRGNVNVQLSVLREAGNLAIRLNEDALAQVLAAAERVRGFTGGAPVSAESVLQVKGVLEIAEPEDDDEAVTQRDVMLTQSLGTALCDLVVSRELEGSKLCSVISELLDDIEARVIEIGATPSRSPEDVARRISEHLRRLVDDATELDPQRLYQEAVLISGKADIEEELQRLKAHISAARDLLSHDEPVGRKLDFLTQEFNREANTICSKANDIAITQGGLALKALIEQMREQVQNIE